MKTLKKILTVILLCLVAAFGLTACKDENNGGSSSVTGVYYLYENDTYNKSDYYELLSGNEWRDNDGEMGTYSVSGSTITFYYSFDDETEELFDGTISDGVMCLNIFDVDTYYCKEGKTPSNNNGSSGNGNGQTETQYTVTYNANGGTFADGETTLTATAKNNSTLTAPDSPTRTNYTFAGWATNSVGSNKWNFSTDKVTGDITLYATWSQESAAILSVDGASIDGLNIFMFVDKNTDSVSLASKVVCSDDSVWKLYYDKLGQTEIPTKIAADISGELLDGDNLFYMVVTSQDGVQVNVYELNVYRSYAIDVCYYDGNTPLKTETAYTGYEFTPNYIPKITGYTFNDWNYEPRILWDDLELYADKTANTYTVTYDVNGGDELATTEKTVTYDSGYTLTKPTRTGYTFLGWYYGETQITDGNGNSLAVWNYTKSLTVKAGWQINEYAVTLSVNNESAGTVSGAGNYIYNSNVTVTATTKSGYTWLGWYDKNDELVSSELSYKFKMGFAVTYMAKWSKTTVTKNISAAGSITSLSGKYVNGQEITVTATTYLGYTFDGWYNNNRLLTTEENYTFTMSAENITYTAKWNVSAEMSNFDFSSSTTTCSITGVKDTTVSEIIVPDYVTSISSGAFSGCSSLTSVTLPFIGGNASATSASRTTLFGYIFGKEPYAGGTSTEQWYASSSYSTYYIPTSLKSVAITGGNVLYGSFYNCKNLTSVTIGKAVTSIGSNAFYKCYKIVEVYNVSPLEIKAGDSSNGYVGYYAKNIYTPTSGQSKISTNNDGYIIYTDGDEKILVGYTGTETNLSLPSGVTQIYQYAFYNCSGLTNVTIGNSVTSIGTYAFCHCSGLTNVTIGNSVASIEEGAFQDCSGLTNITIPDSVVSIGYGAFLGCSGLTSVTIGNSVTNIGSVAFYNCDSLYSVTIPENVTSIGSNAFSNLKKIIFSDTSTWYITLNTTDWRNKTNGTRKSVTDSYTNATNFTDTYKNYYWYKK